MAFTRSASAKSKARPAAEAVRWVSVLHIRLVRQLEIDAVAAGVVPFGWHEVLAALEQAPGNRMRLKEFGEAVLMTKAGVSRLLDRIEAAGYLQRQACAGDGRGFEAVMTAAGAAALTRARPVYARTLDRCFGRHLTGEQTAAMIDLFREILAANNWLPDARPVTVTIGRRSRGG